MTPNTLSGITTQLFRSRTNALKFRWFNFCLVCLTALMVNSAHAELVHHYRFETGVEDSVGNADGTLFNGAQVIREMLVLDGIDDYVQIPEHIIPLSGNYTIAFFAQQTAPQPGEVIEMISQGFSTGPGIYLGHNPGGIIRAGDSWLDTGVAFPADGRLHHYALVANASVNQTFLYIDGELRATLGVAVTSAAGGTATRLGSQFDVGGEQLEWFHGQMDDVRIYDEALDANAVRSLAYMFKDNFEVTSPPISENNDG